MDTTHGAKGWLLWPGVALMVSDALANLMMLVQWRQLWAALRGKKGGVSVRQEEEEKATLLPKDRKSPTNNSDDKSKDNKNNNNNNNNINKNSKEGAEEADDLDLLDEEAAAAASSKESLPLSWCAIGLSLSTLGTTREFCICVCVCVRVCVCVCVCVLINNAGFKAGKRSACVYMFFNHPPSK